MKNNENKRDTIYEGLPCIAEDGKYLIYSPYALKIAEIDKKDISDVYIKNKLNKINFFGKPYKAGDSTGIAKLTLIMTNDCNLQCQYCYMFGGENKKQDLPLNIAIKAIKESVFKKILSQIRISFFGGEPTLVFNEIIKIVEFTKKLGIPYSFHISTNGIISKGILKYIIKEKFNIGVSMDGPPYYNNLQRPPKEGGPKSKIVENTIKELSDKKANYLIRSTITFFNVNAMADSVEYWAKLGANKIHFETLHVSGRAIQEKLKPPAVDDYIKNLKRALNKADELGVFIISSPFMNLLTPSKYYCSPCSGESNIITNDGLVSRCYEVQNQHHPNSLFLVGKFERKSNRIAFNKNGKYLAKVSVEEHKECKNCYAKYLCGGGCHLRNINSNGSIYEVDKYSCKIRKILIREAIKRLKESALNRRVSPVLGINVYENNLFNRDQSSGYEALKINKNRYSKEIKVKKGKTIRIFEFPLPKEVRDVIKENNKVRRIKDRCESVF